MPLIFVAKGLIPLYPSQREDSSLPVTEDAGFAETEGEGFLPGVKKPKGITKGESEEESSLSFRCRRQASHLR